MACVELLGARPNDGSEDHFPRAITPDGSLLYATTTTKVSIFTWPGLSFVSQYALSGGPGMDVTIAPNGDVLHAEVPSTTEIDFYKNNVYTGLTITTAPSIAAGGIAFADGWLWAAVSTSDGGGSGALYRIDPETFATTTPHTVSGSLLSSFVYAATDGAIWYTDNLGTTVYRYHAGSTTSIALAAVNTFMPRSGGVMLGYRTSPSAGFIDISPDLVVSSPSCDPASAGAGLPLTGFNNPSLSDVGFTDLSGDVWRAVRRARWWAGVAGSG